MSFLELNDAEVRREGNTILHVDSFALEEGESIALLGPNGAGKSTFVRLITRDVLPLHRDIPPVLFRGEARITLDEVKRAIGYVSATMQDQIRVHLSAVEVVEGGLFGSLGVPKRFSVSATQHEHALQVMDELDIRQLAGRDILTLSSGQARRVLVARALVHDPQVLVFDEPCTSLDAQGMFWMRHTMRKLAQDGRAIILVTHSLEDVIPEISRVALVQEGRIIQDGAKEAVLTSENISALFGVPLSVRERDGYYSLDMRY